MFNGVSFLALLFPSTLDAFSEESSFGVVNEPSTFTGLVATVAAETVCERGLCNPGGGLLPSTRFSRQVRDVDEADDREEITRGCLLNILESANE